MTTATTPAEVIQALEGRYLIDANGCWIWTSGLDSSGYSRMYLNGGQRVGHRLSFEAHRGPVPEGLELDHLCRVRSCVNPSHLEPVTHAENGRRRSVAQTHCKQGHEFTPENTHITRGRRMCRECNLAAVKRYQARKRVAA